ncbi:MAG: hypothetical protein HPY81_04520 [Firmicutes bacterium]|nr:hypothetical protein [Bacillota bacterium]
MLIPTTTVIGVRCPDCGKIGFHAVSLFAFSAGQPVIIACFCGTEIISLETKDRRNFWVQVNCLLCETRHVLRHSRRQIWSGEILSICCPETGQELGFVGAIDKVRRATQNLDKSLREMALDLGLIDYFDNPDVMYEVLDCLQRLAEKGSLFCQCGNFDIDVEIFPEKIELSCGVCGAHRFIYAQSEDDSEAARRLSEIHLSKEGYSSANSKQLNKSRRRSKNKRNI